LVEKELAVEERGITIEQLETIYQEIEKRTWKDKDNNVLTPDKVNIYDIKDEVIKKLTESDQCSYVEFIATKDQKPVWFVSHSWSGTVKSMINCLKKHRKDRKLPDHTPYWICVSIVYI
jgi:transcriptional regulator NrdR family protein